MLNPNGVVWSPQQDKALVAVQKWFRAGDSRLFYLAGYAGTGKTTLAKEIAAGCGNVLFGAFTGKAASVLRSKGCHGANTLHSLMYRPTDVYWCRNHPQESVSIHEGKCPLCSEELRLRNYPEFVLNEESPLHDADLLIVDECSMVDQQLGTDVMSFGIPVLSIGDPAQLLPVRDEAGYFTAGEPDVMLTEIHRQAQGNPIIAMATRVREGRRLVYGAYGDSAVKRRSELAASDLEHSDIRLAGRNKTIQWLNTVWRHAGKFTDETPMAGEKVLCLRNNARKGLLNGTLWDVVEVMGKNEHLVRMRIKPEEGGFVREVTAPAKFFRALREGEDQWPTDESFMYGYAMTVHKAQGSEWNDVLVFDESGLWGAEANNWLYTAITRAANRVTVIRN